MESEGKRSRASSLSGLVKSARSSGSRGASSNSEASLDDRKKKKQKQKQKHREKRGAEPEPQEMETLVAECRATITVMQSQIDMLQKRRALDQMEPVPQGVQPRSMHGAAGDGYMTGTTFFPEAPVVGLEDGAAPEPLETEDGAAEQVSLWRRWYVCCCFCCR
jgi:hypothetical protein